MTVKVDKSDCKRKKKRKSSHNERKLLKDDEGGVMRGGIGSSTAVSNSALVFVSSRVVVGSGS